MVGFMPLSLVSFLSQSSSDGGFVGGYGVVIVVVVLFLFLFFFFLCYVVATKVEWWLWPVVVVVVMGEVVGVVDGRGGYGWCCGCFFR